MCEVWFGALLQGEVISAEFVLMVGREVGEVLRYRDTS